jgi:hypothetical protein
MSTNRSVSDLDGTAGVPIRLGVVGAGDTWVARLREALSSRVALELVAVAEIAALEPLPPEGAGWDVAIAFLNTRSLAALSEVLAGYDRLGFPELVVVCECANDTAAQALREFGVGRVLAQDLAPQWLADSLAPLASIAFAKRLLRQSHALLGTMNPMTPMGNEALPLAVAEARFREAYLRALMASTSSRHEAAARARVPYRTLCYMLDRFGIRERALRIRRVS